MVKIDCKYWEKKKKMCTSIYMKVGETSECWKYHINHIGFKNPCSELNKDLDKATLDYILFKED